MKIIGITGGIGSGKSTVSKILLDLGAELIDADKIAKEVVQIGKPALLDLISVFSKEILLENGELDRKKFGDIIFKDKKKLEITNKITHKYVSETILKIVKEKKKYDLLVIDVPIPVKDAFLDIVDEVWVVLSDEKIRIDRVMKRSNLSYEDVVNRIRSQQSDDIYIKIADKIIYNNGNLDELVNKVNKNFNEFINRLI